MKIQTNTYPVDAPYGNGTIHYYNIIDKGERPVDLSEMEVWNRYEADYEIVGDYVVNDSVKTVKTLYRKYTTINLVEQEIELMNQLLGYPDGKGTYTYSAIPEPTIIKDEEGNEIERFWLMKCTHDLQEALIEKGGLDLPMVSVEVLADGSIVVTDETIQANSLDGLADNVKSYEIQVPREALYEADQETIETLLGDGNIL